jgi:hypothetical protein
MDDDELRALLGETLLAVAIDAVQGDGESENTRSKAAAIRAEIERILGERDELLDLLIEARAWAKAIKPHTSEYGQERITALLTRIDAKVTK